MGVQSKFVRGDDGAALKEALFRETGVDGVYARTGLYEGVVEALGALISAYRPAGADQFIKPIGKAVAAFDKQGKVVL